MGILIAWTGWTSEDWIVFLKYILCFILFIPYVILHFLKKIPEKIYDFGRFIFGKDNG